MEGAASQQAQQNSRSHRRVPDPAPSASSSRVTRSRQRVIDQVLAHDEPDEESLLAQQERKTPGSRGADGKAPLRASTSAASLLTPPESETTGRSARDTAKGVRRSKRLSLLTPSESSPGEEAGAEEAHLVEQDEESPLKR